MYFTWKGKEIEDLSREDLVELVNFQIKSTTQQWNYELEELKKKNGVLQKENDRLWRCLGDKA